MLREQSPATLSSTDIPFEWQGMFPHEIKKMDDPARSLKNIKLENTKRAFTRKRLGRHKPQK